MEIDIELTENQIPDYIPSWPLAGEVGAWVEFRGLVRGMEDGRRIAALEYEAYPEMARLELRRLLVELAEKHPCLATRVIHRVGVIPVGEAAIYIGAAGKHRAEAIALVADFMTRLKQDVPIWKRGGRSAGLRPEANSQTAGHAPDQKAAGQLLSLDAALAEIHARCQSLPATRIPLDAAYGCVLRETVCAPEDSPLADRSTRDGYAILVNDMSESFQVVDTLHAADWKPRSLKPGEAVRVATGSALPAENLRVVMQEDVERNGDRIRVLRHESTRNIRVRGEDMQKGQPLVPSGTRMDAGALALLASVGWVEPLGSPRLRVWHFTTGDEIIPPGQTPKPGQIRDSNSILVRNLLQRFTGDVAQSHLPENFEAAKADIQNQRTTIENANVLLISGGASVGDKDFTRALLEWLGFEIVFSGVNLRPGKPLIFAVKGAQIAFGLPGNPLSHYVCFQTAVAAALARLTGEAPPTWRRGRLAQKLTDASSPRETLWPARWEWLGAAPALRPLSWASSGDITFLPETNALIRVPTNTASMVPGSQVDFLPTGAFGPWLNSASHKLDAISRSA